MNILIVFLFLAFTLILIVRGEISATHFARQKFFIAYLGVIIIAITVAQLSNNNRIENSVFLFKLMGTSFLAFAIGRVINSIKNRGKSIYFTLNQPLGLHLFQVGLLLIIILGNLLSEKELLLNNVDNSIFHYLIYTYGQSFLSLTGIAFIFFDVFQNINVHDEGIFHNGFLWEWSNFHSYTIEDNPKNEKFQKLTLNYSKKIWGISDIYLKINREDSEKLDTWLSQKLLRA